MSWAHVWPPSSLGLRAGSVNLKKEREISGTQNLCLGVTPNSLHNAKMGDALTLSEKVNRALVSVPSSPSRRQMFSLPKFQEIPSLGQD